MAPSSLWVVRTVTHGEMAVGGRGSQALPLVGLVLPWQANPTVPNVSSGPQGPHVWQWAFPDHFCEQLSLHPAPGTGSCGRSPWVLASERALPTLVPAEGRPVGGGTEPHSPPAGARLGERSAELLAGCGAHAARSSSAGPDPALPPGLRLSSRERSGAAAEAAASAGQAHPALSSCYLLSSLGDVVTAPVPSRALCPHLP